MPHSGCSALRGVNPSNNKIIIIIMIIIIIIKVRKYQGQVDSYRQNRLFENNQRQFYRELDQEEERCDDQPVAEESRQF